MQHSLHFHDTSRSQWLVICYNHIGMVVRQKVVLATSKQGALKGGSYVACQRPDVESFGIIHLGKVN